MTGRPLWGLAYLVVGLLNIYAGITQMFKGELGMAVFNLSIACMMLWFAFLSLEVCNGR